MVEYKAMVHGALSGVYRIRGAPHAERAPPGKCQITILQRSEQVRDVRGERVGTETYLQIVCVGGYAYSLGSGVISWSCRKQKTVASSSCEAEYTAAFESCKEAIWLRALLTGIGFGPL